MIQNKRPDVIIVDDTYKPDLVNHLELKSIDFDDDGHLMARYPLRYRLFENKRFLAFMRFFGWVPNCIANCPAQRSFEYADCDGPFCMRWEFRPDITS